MTPPKIVAAILFGLLIVPQTEASILYSTTDLGAGYQLETRPDGSAYGVSNASGSVVYAFDKSPVTNIDADIPNLFLDLHGVYTLQNGSYKTGFYYYMDFGGSNFIRWPVFEQSYHDNWTTISSSPPVLDINSGGQIVGTSDSYGVGGGPQSIFLKYATFTDINGQPHGDDASVSDNLNNYIATIPGVTLTSADKIDDLGRIIAEGSDGHDYLLTPIAMGSPATVPEPSTLAMMGVAGSCLAVRSIRRGAARPPAA